MYNANGFDDDSSFKNDDVIHISVTKDMKRKYKVNDGFLHGTAESFRECYLTFALIALNVIIYYIQTTQQYREGYFLVDRLSEHGACSWPDVIGHGQVWRLITCMFLHGSWGHLIGNMIVLLLCGSILERVLYRNCYLILYFVGGLCASLVSMVYHHFIPTVRTINYFFYSEKIEIYDVRSLGASGAIAALFAGLVIYLLFFGGFGNSDISRSGWMWLIIGYLVISTLSSIFSYEEGVDMAGHMGGLACGCVIFFIYACIAYRDQRTY